MTYEIKINELLHSKSNELLPKSFEEIFSLLQIRCKGFNFEQGSEVGEIFWKVIIVNSRRSADLYFGNCSTYNPDTGENDYYALTKQLTDFYYNPHKYTSK